MPCRRKNISIGIKGVTSLLENGQMVTVDANHLSVYDGKIEALLNQTRKSKHLMKGSPVYRTLQEVSRHIVPLNLFDPDGQDFRAKNC